MSVYVDDYAAGFGRMIMCHMIADTPAELLEMADRIGVSRRWIQYVGTWKEHFDVCKAKRAAAVAAGAIEISRREFVAIVAARRTVYARGNDGTEKR